MRMNTVSDKASLSELFCLPSEKSLLKRKGICSNEQILSFKSSSFIGRGRYADRKSQTLSPAYKMAETTKYLRSDITWKSEEKIL